MQKETFLTSEGDEWFRRNTPAQIENHPQDLNHIFETLVNEKNHINRILEIGCSGGIKTHKIAEFFEAKGCVT